MASRPLTPRLDLALGIALLTTGVGFIAYASRGGPSAFHFVPALDGCLAMGIVAFVLALIEGFAFSQAVLVLLPVLVLQSIGAREHHSSWFALMGMEALVFGAVGTALGSRARRLEPPQSRAGAAPSAPRTPPASALPQGA